jgi:hypothetical protein
MRNTGTGVYSSGHYAETQVSNLFSSYQFYFPLAHLHTIDEIT